MKKLTFVFGILLVLSMVLTACSPQAAATEVVEAVETAVEEVQEGEEAEIVEETEARVPAIALVPAGQVSTEGFMMLAGNGYKKAAEDFGFPPVILESMVAEEWERNVRTASQDGAELVIGIGSTMEDAVKNVAPEFPDTKYVLVDAYTGEPNVMGLISQEQEGTFLAGIVAAYMTSMTDVKGINEEKVIGFVGGMDVPVIHRFLSGLQQGAAYVDPDVKVEVAYVGSFADPAKAKELALQLIENQKADIVFSVAGSYGDAGVFEAVMEKEVYGIGSDINWDEIHPGYILTSVLKHTDVAVYDAIERYLNGQFEAGEVKYGVASGVMDLTDMSVIGDLVPQEVKDAVLQAKQDIKDGKIVVERPTQ